LRIPPIFALTLLLFPCLANAQLNDSRLRDLGSGYAHLLAVAAEPEIAVSSINIEHDEQGLEDASLKGVHLPLYREFDIEGSENRWYLQGSLGYVTLEEEHRLQIPDLDDSLLGIDFEWTAYNGLLESGMVLPLGKGFSLAPGFSLGLSRLENSSDFSSKLLEDLLAPVADGVLYNWSTNAVLSRAHLALRYDQQHGSYRLKSSAHLTYSHVDSYSESSRFPGFTDHSGAAVFKFDVSRRVNSPEAKRPVNLIGHLGATSFLGDTRDNLGFSSFGEVGLSVGVSKYAAGVLMVFGDDVDGVSLTFQYDY
jgi:hypothetical protein